ncbi:cytochrome C [Herbaspirillum sp. meg3]|uniref:c-type cytochrome n=1 Tax=Herbaspirillum sp. meg3 TaxID=2025949 RepID=UPI000B988118|nr:cytochrome c [Herbaspirillum sp. meg3]ASU41373.1 cytochrome C [Herbaspirillum sp. meg3]
MTRASLLSSRPFSQRDGAVLLNTLLSALLFTAGVASVHAQEQSLEKPPAPPAAVTPAAAAPATSATPANPVKADIESGRYLAIAADCMACHTAPAGKPYAGGYAIESPLGTIYATNITPSKTAGIGNYSEAQFARALREGVRADGSHLYPAMPYTSYAMLTDSDVHKLYSYFMNAVTPVNEPASSQTKLPFPFNVRMSMTVWNAIFLDTKRFVPDASKSQQINRGKYLADGLAHCSTCHTPRNFLMGEKGGSALAGAPLGPWHAPNITSDKVSGVGGWSDAELMQYLKTGHVEGKGQAGGAMAEAVTNSFQHLRDDDIAAIVAYLRTVPPVRDATQSKPAYSYGKAVSDESALRGTRGPNEHNSLNSGAVLFSGYCASCHAASGAGSNGQDYPSLFNNTATGSHNPANLVSAILYGVERKVGDKEILMPRFDAHSYVNPLTDQQIAMIANYVLKQYGNPEVQVSEAYVAQARKGGEQPILAKLQPYIAPAIGIAIVLLLLIIFAVISVRRRRRIPF